MHVAGLKRWLVLGALLVAPVAFGPSALAQTTSSALEGFVRAADGTPAVGVVVQARSDDTGAVRSAVTDARGRYDIDLLSPGPWTVVASADDGRRSPPQRVVLRLQQRVALDLTVGPVLAESVSVVSETPALDPARTTAELRVGRGQVDSLPVSGRVFTDLALLDSSIRPTPPGNFYGERGSVFVVNGQSGRANSFLVDGLDNNDQTSNTTLNSFFSEQVIRDFVVMTHQYAPEFGRASGGVLNIVTEQGTNNRTGEAFAQGTSSGWNSAGSFVSSLPNPSGEEDAVGRAAAGFDLGGPIKKDKAFYFVAYEHQQGDDVAPYTGVDRNGVAGGFLVAPSRDDNLFLRTDFNLNPSTLLMVRLSADDRSTDGLNVAGDITPEAGFRLDEQDFQLAASLTSVVSEDFVIETRLLAGTSSFDQFANSDRPGVSRPSGTFGGNDLNRQLRDEDRFQIVENFTVRNGPHLFKVGMDVLKSRTHIETRFNPNGSFLYTTDQPFEPGDCGDILASQVHGHCSEDGARSCTTDSDCRDICRFDPVPCPGVPGVDDDGDGKVDEPGLIETYAVAFTHIEGEPKATLDDVRLALFAQDGWQATPKLYLDYGLRYDLSTFVLPESARVPSTIENGGAGRDYDNVAPRLGFTYRPTASGRFLLRGGAGVFYDKLVLGFPAIAAITSGTRIGLLFPQGLTFEITEDVLEQYGDLILDHLVFPEKLQLRFSTGTRLDTPSTNQFNLGAEWAVGRSGALEVNAVRELGYHEPLMIDLNPVVLQNGKPVYGGDGLPVHVDTTTGSIAAVVTDGRIWYTGVDLGWKWRGASSWYSASYTWSKALDLGPDPLKGGIGLPSNSTDLEAEKGPSDSDRRHRLVLAGEAPLGFLGLRMSGVIQAASGAPFNVTTGRDENLDGVASDRPAGIGRNTGADTPLGPVNDLRAVFDLPPVTSLRQPDLFQIDLRVSRPFGSSEGKMRGDAFLQIFNVLDRFNGGPVDGRVTSRTFGEPIGQIGPPRTIEIGLKLGF